MSNLNVLPAELLIVVVRTIHNSLPSLVLVSEHLHHVLNPILYRFIHYIDKEAALVTTDFPDWSRNLHQCSSAIAGLRQDSRITQLDLLVRTLVEFPHLRPMILGASFQWDKNRRSSEDEILRVIDLLKCSVRFIHLGTVNMP